MSDAVIESMNWLADVLMGWGIAPGIANFLAVGVEVLVLITVALITGIILVWVERKTVARFQDRLGPNRVGPFGLIQPFADIVKLLIKEDITPDGASKFVYNIAPLLSIGSVLLIWAVIPFAPTLLGSDINVGILYIVGAGAIGTLAIIMAGFSSNNKYALLGAFRTVAQMVSYEVPLVIVLLIPVLLTGSMGINQIVNGQNIWYLFVAPLAAIIFLVSSIAENGRTPFDLLEAESEIVAGFHIEYTGMKFGLFYAGELIHAVTIGLLFSTLFLGGWSGPFVEQLPVLGLVYLVIKAFIVYFIIMWIRYSFPRIRIDHMLSLNWKFLTPLALVLLMVTAIVHKLLQGAPNWSYILVMLLVNIIIIVITLWIVRRFVQIQRTRFEENRPVARAEVTELPVGGGD